MREKARTKCKVADRVVKTLGVSCCICSGQLRMRRRELESRVCSPCFVKQTSGRVFKLLPMGG